jgi:hypothetical protein
VKLAPFNPDEEDASVLWTESKDVGKGFRCVRMVNNTHLGFDAFHGDKDHGGVHDGTAVVLWEWCKGDNQSWKILPWGPEADSPAAGPGNFSFAGVPVHTVRVYCKAGGEEFNLIVRNGTACLAPTNPRDDYQVQYYSVGSCIAAVLRLVVEQQIHVDAALGQGHEAQHQDP